MPTRNTSNAGRNTRSKVGSKDNNPDSHIAAPNARAPSKSIRHPITHPRVTGLPHGKVNKGKKIAVSPNDNTSMGGKSKSNKKALPTTEGNTSVSHQLSLSRDHDQVSAEGVTEGTGHAQFPDVSDNREIAIQTEPPAKEVIPPSQTELLLSMASELKTIRVRMDKLDKIEAATSSLDSKIGSLLERTTSLETSVASNSTKLQAVDTEVVSLKEAIDLQGRAVAKLTTMKADITKKNKSTMDTLIGQQKEQAESIQQNTKRMEQLEKNFLDQVNEKVQERVGEISQNMEKNFLDRVDEKVEEQVGKISQDISFKSMKDQAFQKRHNLIFAGMEEDHTKSLINSAKDLCRSLGVDRVNIYDAFRLGSPPQEGSTYCRPLVVRFSKLSDRNRVWRKRNEVNSEEGRPIKIQADLPKKLRDETGILYRVTRAAANFKKYKKAAVRNYAIQLNGKEFHPHNLEDLPYPLRPSTISNPRSDTALAFFSKYSALSNHHPSVFVLDGQQFQSMEHFLAYEKAKLSGKDDTIQRAQLASDPKEAKAILSSLREDHPAEWDNKVKEITIKGLKAKFSQNDRLLSFLRNTKNLQIGEASKNPRWGIGLTLNDAHVLDTEKWDPAGNLLGRCLMRIRDELCRSE